MDLNLLDYLSGSGPLFMSSTAINMRCLTSGKHLMWQSVDHILEQSAVPGLTGILWGVLTNSQQEYLRRNPPQGPKEENQSAYVQDTTQGPL